MFEYGNKSLLRKPRAGFKNLLGRCIQLLIERIQQGFGFSRIGKVLPQQTVALLQHFVVNRERFEVMGIELAKHGV